MRIVPDFTSSSSGGAISPELVAGESHDHVLNRTDTHLFNPFYLATPQRRQRGMWGAAEACPVGERACQSD